MTRVFQGGRRWIVICRIDKEFTNHPLAFRKSVIRLDPPEVCGIVVQIQNMPGCEICALCYLAGGLFGSAVKGIHPVEFKEIGQHVPIHIDCIVYDKIQFQNLHFVADNGRQNPGLPGRIIGRVDKE